jgi:hypothetical protein
MKNFGHPKIFETSASRSQNPTLQSSPHSQTPMTSPSSAARPSWVETGLKDARAIASSALPPLQQEWGDFVRYRDWDLFATLTFENQVHAEQAHRRWNAFVHALQHSRFRDSKQHPLIWIRATELQSRGVLHYHALLANVRGVPPLIAMRLWERAAGGYARVLPYDQRRGGAYYLVKRASEIDLSATWFDDASRGEKH